ncbi:ABC transporter permease [Paenibacillus turpanensis]|uniref:ABC transporter permease n=1 Tax=Paenibacillus turpanensis TaxID=2689078 RepID=UPI001FB78081|nr:ABC transporter permease [Paenibacillus turpanensis]
MALFTMILRKMAQNRWLMLSLFGGMILSAALASSMPIYKHAILQRMLVKELEQSQMKTGTFPASFTTRVHASGDTAPELRLKLFHETDAYLKRMEQERLPVDMLASVRERYTDMYTFVAADSSRYDPTVERDAQLQAISGLEEHIRLIDGRMPSASPVNGVYEVLVVERALNHLDLVLGQELIMQDKASPTPLRVMPVGVFEKKDDRDVFFSATSLGSYQSALFVPFELFEKSFTVEQVIPVRGSEWHFALNYNHIKLQDVQTILALHKEAEGFFAERYANYTMSFPLDQILTTYFEKEQRLQTLLWSLNVPVMALLMFYLLMVTGLIMDRQKTEISVIRSRGASRAQVMGSYFVESVLLAAIALVPGVWLGLGLTKVLGASNGFLEYVNRSALAAELSAEAWKYGAAAVGAAVLLMLIPAFLASRMTIVSQKRASARGLQRPLWHKWFLDLVLIAIALYGYTMFRRRTADLTALGLDSSDLAIDPLLFLVPSLFAVGFGLLLLRLYPLVIQGIYAMFRSRWSPSAYNSLIQVGRSIHQYQFLMIFIILTMSTGMFSASAARTMNENMDDQIRYQAGSDVVLTFQWQSDAPAGDDGASSLGSGKRVQYTEPPFDAVRDLPGVQDAARVFIKGGAVFSAGNDRGTAKLFGIDTDEFGRASWMKDGLLPHHYYDYLNLIAEDPSAVLISRTMAEAYNVKEGDTLMVGWEKVEAKPFIVYGIIDYFPTFNPMPQPSEKAGEKPVAPMLIVGHLDTIQNRLALEPYEAWVSLTEPVARKELLEGIEKAGLPLESYSDTLQRLTDSKNDPFRLAINGVMTLGFIASVFVCFCGFLLYWILTLRGRTLQIGVFRAMGISLKEVITMLTLEQLLTSGAGLVIGLAAGNVTSRLFVPLFQLGFDPKTTVPPFQVQMEAADLLKLNLFFGTMIVLALGILAFMLTRIKIHQAVKLGED